MKFCENCGSELIPNAKFCGNCGAPVPEAADMRAVPPETAPEENTHEENTSEPETGISYGGTFSYGGQSNGNETEGVPDEPHYQEADEMPEESVQQEMPKSGMSVQGKGDDGPHGWNYDVNSPYSCGTAGKGKHEGAIVKIAVIVVIAVAVLIVLVFLGINRAKKNIESIAQAYNSSEVFEEELEELEEELEEKDVEKPANADGNDSFVLDGVWTGEYTILDAGEDAEDFYDYGKWYDASAYIGEDESGRKFFEVYDGEDEDVTILSMYIEETEYGFKGVFGGEDAWLYDKYLTSEDEVFYDITVDDGRTIYLACPYHDAESGYDYVILMYFEK